jgi:hypothetical protein
VLSLDDVWVTVEDVGPEGAQAGEPRALPAPADDRPMLLETREVAQNHMLGRLFAGAGKRSDDAKNAGSREKRPMIR